MFRLSFIFMISVVCGSTFAQDMTIGTPAEFWGQRTAREKVVFLEGLCEGLSTSSQHKLGEQPCNASQPAGKQRFCFAVNINGGKEAVAYLDQFYRNKSQTEIPLWAAIGAYNDNSCNEDLVSSNLAIMQKRNQCFRQSMNMFASQGLSEKAKKAQQEHCKKIGK